MINEKLPKIWYGGDYNPEQWDREIWDEDARMFKLAGIDVATVNVFSWALNQPDEDTYQFEWLDEVIDHLYRNGTYICLATSTGAHPAWMAKRYPDVTRVDFEGRKHKFGVRHNSCPNSPTYRKYSAALAGKLAERYKDHPGLLVWHVSNEYGGYCYCDNCEAQFKVWLQNKYGTLDNLNRAWNTRFWSHTFYHWDEIVAPNALSEVWIGRRGTTNTAFQGIRLDYNRFMSDSLLECYKLEHNEIKKHTPNIPITTNLMGTFKDLDYFKWAQYMDIVSWDNYPAIDTPVSLTAMRHDLMRGLKNGDPFMLMEQTPSQQNWQAFNSLKRPGVMRLWSYQSVARGADTVLFFQLRRSRGACEKYHGAVIEHVGHEHTRVFRECAELGQELNKLGDKLLDSRVKSKVAIMFDWDNWWAIEMSSGPSVALNYVVEVHKYYDALFKQNIQVDMIGTDTDLSGYDIVLAPVLYMVKPGVAGRIEQYVQSGGTFLTTFFSGIVDENDLVVTGGYPGELRPVLGIWAEEIDALAPGVTNRVVISGQLGASKDEYTCGMLCDIIHSEGAEVVAVYGDDFYKGSPVVTVNRYGKGKAWYVATSPDADFLTDLMAHICADQGVKPVLVTPEDVEVSMREKNGEQFIFVMNHSADSKQLSLGADRYVDLLTDNQATDQVELMGRQVMILQKIK